jgi:preprotein translocase subunit SecF
MGALAQGIQSVAGVHVQLLAAKDAPSNTLLQSAEASSTLGSSPYSFHYLPPGLNAVPIEEVRASLKSIGSVAVQSMGKPAERHFMIRVEDSQFTGDKGIETAKITQALETKFGEENVAVITANYVGSRFSKQLTDQAGLLMFLTMLLILVYVSFRFKPQFAIGAVLAIAHDALIMVAFITWTRMEFNTTQIAAILTILGYSINDTIVIFDRVREDLRIYPDDPFVLTMDRAISETLSRTIITTLTTMLAVFSLFFFTTGTMKDFALALLIGMTSGCYSTIFIACGFANFWQNHIKGRFGKKKASVAAVAA